MAYTPNGAVPLLTPLYHGTTDRHYQDQRLGGRPQLLRSERAARGAQARIWLPGGGHTEVAHHGEGAAERKGIWSLYPSGQGASDGPAAPVLGAYLYVLAQQGRLPVLPTEEPGPGASPRGAHRGTGPADPGGATAFQGVWVYARLPAGPGAALSAGV